MNFQRLTLLLFILSLTIPAAFARKPAVEDFVGVETKDYSRTPQGTEVLFDFGNIIKATPSETTSNTEFTTTLVLTSFILLPFAMWFGITRRQNSQIVHEEETPMAPVTNLSDYQKQESKEDVKKAS